MAYVLIVLGLVSIGFAISNVIKARHASGKHDLYIGALRGLAGGAGAIALGLIMHFAA